MGGGVLRWAENHYRSTTQGAALNSANELTDAGGRLHSAAKSDDQQRVRRPHPDRR